MLCHNALSKGSRAFVLRQSLFVAQRRCLHNDGRNRLSTFWAPSQRSIDNSGEPENGHDLLVRAGFLRQAHAGIFHLLPLGLRVQDKIEKLIDKHMRGIGASKVSLSSLSSEELWAKSGRLEKGRSSELLRLEDRRGAKYLLSPTHEEEITSIISSAVHSYKDLPLRLYQVSRKYRDELRPRQGLLRGREFLMKDLYTFDATEDAARETYDQVRKAYAGFFDELNLPYLTAAASSGNMGGTLSHEYHLASPNGEDTIITCDKCDLSTNEELFVIQSAEQPEWTDDLNPRSIGTACYLDKDRTTRYVLHYPEQWDPETKLYRGYPNVHALKSKYPDIDARIEEEHSSKPVPQVHIFDPRLKLPLDYVGFWSKKIADDPIHKGPLVQTEGPYTLFTKARPNDPCPSCSEGHIKLQQAVEIGHRFHLGTRYSEPLNARITNEDNKVVPVQMGCHGIGVSRLIGACASLMADKSGLNWPLAIAPFEILIIPGPNVPDDEAAKLYDDVLEEVTRLRPLMLGGHVDEANAAYIRANMDLVIDDRARPLGWKLKDADLVGYPIVIVMGRRWAGERVVELQCRRLGLKEERALDGKMTFWDGAGSQFTTGQQFAGPLFDTIVYLMHVLRANSPEVMAEIRAKLERYDEING